MPASTAAASPRRATALPPDERRAAIVAAVRPLLIQYGERMTSRQIADAAGVAEGTVFRVFADKDELIVAAVDAALDLAPFDEAVRAIDPSLPLDERLVEVTELSLRRVDDISQMVSALRPDLRDRISRPLSPSPALVELFEAERDALRVEPDVAARMLRALTLSLRHPMLGADPMSARDIVDVVLHGVALPDRSAR